MITDEELIAMARGSTGVCSYASLKSLRAIYERGCQDALLSAARAGMEAQERLRSTQPAEKEPR